MVLAPMLLTIQGSSIKFGWISIKNFFNHISYSLYLSYISHTYSLSYISYITQYFSVLDPSSLNNACVKFDDHPIPYSPVTLSVKVYIEELETNLFLDPFILDQNLNEIIIFKEIYVQVYFFWETWSNIAQLKSKYIMLMYWFTCLTEFYPLVGQEIKILRIF